MVRIIEVLNVVIRHDIISQSILDADDPRNDLVCRWILRSSGAIMKRSHC